MMSIAAPEPKANMGEPIPRYDAVAKVTGRADYAADVPLANPVYAYLVTSSIAKGRIDGFDLTDAKTGSRRDRYRDPRKRRTAEGSKALQQRRLFLHHHPAAEIADIAQEGQIVAVVLADNFEAAREAAHAVKVNTPRRPRPRLSTRRERRPRAPRDSSPSSRKIRRSATSPRRSTKPRSSSPPSYETPAQHHNPMELFATSCVWNGDRLTIYEPSQYVHGLKNGVAEQLGIDADKVRVINPYVGGAFGSKGSMTPRTAIIASIARRLDRPVKLVATRDQGFTIATYRAETRHQIQIGAGRDGKLTALRHEGCGDSRRALTPTPSAAPRPRPGSMPARMSTAWSRSCAPTATPQASCARRPEVPYMFALESAMDELAVKLNMDPIELRRVNDTMNEPIGGKPYTSRSLMACFDEGAKAFGWSKRKAAPKSMTDGDWLIGYGCATSLLPDADGAGRGACAPAA